MKIIKHSLSLILLSAVGFFLFLNVTNQVSAGNLWEMQEEGIKDGIAAPFDGDINNPDDIRLVVIYIIKVFLTFVGIIFLIMIIIAGSRWMMSQGDQDKIKTSKAQIFAAIIGFMVIISSYVIVNFVHDVIRREALGAAW